MRNTLGTPNTLETVPMKCFVASAFGRDDVDAIYDGCIRPALKKVAAQPLRVDRIEHNGDIDDMIFHLLDSAEFAIVDLTYARPSVYYEAGYAAGCGKPVIYIARSDHLRARDSDPDGLLRVHFDLQMKNIVSWSAPNEAFRKRLESRLRHVLAPLLKQQLETERLIRERQEFMRLPQSSKLARLSASAVALLRVRGFKTEHPKAGTRVRRGAPSAAGASVARESGGVRQEVAVIATPSALKKLFQSIEFRGSLGVEFGRHRLPTEVHYMVVSLASVPRSRVVSALPGYQLLDDTTLHQRYRSDPRPDVDVFVHLLAGVKSEAEFADSLRAKLREYGLEKGG